MEGLTPSNTTSTHYDEADVSGAPGVGSIPQLLRNARALMLTHTDQLTESLDRLAAKSLSTRYSMYFDLTKDGNFHSVFDESTDLEYCMYK